MISTKELKVSKRVAVILLIAVFSIAGIVACAGDDITGSGRGNNYTQTPVGPTGPTTNTNSGGSSGGGSDLPGMDTNDTWEMPKPDWGDDTYYTIYIPFMGRTNVSYKDTTTLNTLYRRFIERGLGGKGGRWFIRDGGNTLADPTQGSYYYFDKDLNIRYGGTTYPGYHKRLMKRYLGAVIINYSWNAAEWGDRGRLRGTWSIGGLYETMVSKLNDPDYGQGYFQYTGTDYQYLRRFMGSYAERTRGHVEIVLMNEGYSDGNYNEFGLDIYMCTTPKNAYTGSADVEYKQAYYAYKSYLGADPSAYTKKLDNRTNLAISWGKYTLADKYGRIVDQGWQKFTYFSYRPSAWHLE